MQPNHLLALTLVCALIWSPLIVLRAVRFLDLLVSTELLNLRMYWLQRKLHYQLCRLIKEMDPQMPLPDFRFVRIQDRARP